jgi:hypothetical protein
MTNTITKNNIDDLSFVILRDLYVSYKDTEYPFEDVIAALPTVCRALQQSGSWDQLMEDVFIRG